MFDPLNGPNNDYRGPASGLSPEHGDSWRVACQKINAMFEALYKEVFGEDYPSVNNQATGPDAADPARGDKTAGEVRDEFDKQQADSKPLVGDASVGTKQSSVAGEPFTTTQPEGADPELSAPADAPPSEATLKRVDDTRNNTATTHA